MRRALVAATLLAIPILGGFECDVSVTPWVVGDTCTWGSFDDSQCQDSDTLLYCGADGYVTSRSCAGYCDGGSCLTDMWGYGWCECPDAWTPGAICDYWNDYPGGNFCYDPQTVYMCNADSAVQAWDCTTACPSGVTGYCDYNSDYSAYWCMCPDWAWAAGYSCDYYTQYDAATCDGDMLTYCADTNVIGEISCSQQCQDWYGAGATATCGPQTDAGGANGCGCEITIDTCFTPYCFDGLWYVDCDPTTLGEVWWDCNQYCQDQSLGTKGVCSVDTCVCG